MNTDPEDGACRWFFVVSKIQLIIGVLMFIVIFKWHFGMWKWKNALFYFNPSNDMENYWGMVVPFMLCHYGQLLLIRSSIKPNTLLYAVCELPRLRGYLSWATYFMIGALWSNDSSSDESTD